MSIVNRKDLEIELASVLIVMARQVELWTERAELSASYIGAQEGIMMLDVNPNEVVLTRFPMAQRVLEAHGYAFAPTGDDAPDLTDLHGLADMLSGLPREDFSGGISAFPNVGGNTNIEDVCQAVWARAAIDGIDDGLTIALSTKQLALLADMTEGAVRNAMTLSGEAGLTAIPKSKPVRVDVDEARRWLSGRRGFHPTPVGRQNDPILNERLRAFDRIEQLSDFIERHAIRLHGGLSELANTVSWDVSAIMAWRNGTYKFDAAQAYVLGNALGADAPTFSGKALELALRRDVDKEDGQ